MTAQAWPVVLAAGVIGGGAEPRQPAEEVEPGQRVVERVARQRTGIAGGGGVGEAVARFLARLRRGPRGADLRGGAGLGAARRDGVQVVPSPVKPGPHTQRASARSQRAPIAVQVMAAQGSTPASTAGVPASTRGAPPSVAGVPASPIEMPASTGGLPLSTVGVPASLGGSVCNEAVTSAGSARPTPQPVMNIKLERKRVRTICCRPPGTPGAALSRLERTPAHPRDGQPDLLSWFQELGQHQKRALRPSGRACARH